MWPELKDPYWIDFDRHRVNLNPREESASVNLACSRLAFLRPISAVFLCQFPPTLAPAHDGVIELGLSQSFKLKDEVEQHRRNLRYAGATSCILEMYHLLKFLGRVSLGDLPHPFEGDPELKQSICKQHELARDAIMQQHQDLIELRNCIAHREEMAGRSTSLNATERSASDELFGLENLGRIEHSFFNDVFATIKDGKVLKIPINLDLVGFLCLTYNEMQDALLGSN